MARRGLLLILSSPSGAGKSTLSQAADGLGPDDPLFRLGHHPHRPGRARWTGATTTSASRPEFEAMVAAGEMLEHAEVFGNLYGSPRAPVEAAMADGRDTVFDIDWQGGQQIKQAMRDDVVSIFILPPSIAELERRLRSRGQDSDEVIAGRMAKSRDEISHWAEYDYVLVNDDLDQTEDELHAIVTAERLRRDRQPELSDFVRAPEPRSSRPDDLCTRRHRPEIDADSLGRPRCQPHRQGGDRGRGLGLVRRDAARRQRGDPGGRGSNVQENCVLHTDMGFPLIIGANCTIGHKAMLHGCTIGEGIADRHGGHGPERRADRARAA